MSTTTILPPSGLRANAVSDALRSTGQAVLAPVTFHELVGAEAGDLDALRPSWDDLSPDTYLKDTFGTPAAPTDISAPLKLTKDHLAEGARLFKRHCLDCHNRRPASGAGRLPGILCDLPRADVVVLPA